MDYNKLASKETVEKAMAALRERGHLPEFVQTKEEALRRIQELIPAGASVMNGASKTLIEIGFVDYLKGGQHGWNNLHAAILAEKDPARQSMLRRQSALSDFYLGSVHAVTEEGQILVASNSGSQLPHIVFTSPNMIFVVGAQKLVPGIDDAFDRLEKHVIPLEDARMKQVFGPESGTYPSRVLVWNREPAYTGRKSHVIFVNESLGF